MQISLRSQLAAGMAVAGAAAIAVAPVVQPQVVNSLDRMSANVQMVVWDNPITVLFGSLGMGSAYLFGTTQATDPDNPYFGVQDLVPVMPFVLDPTTTPPITGQALVPLGWLPQLLNPMNLFSGESEITTLSGTPLLQAFGSNLSGYTFAALEGLNGLAGGLAAALFGVPFTLLEVIGDVVAGDPIPTITEIIDSIVDPIVGGFTTFANAATYIGTNLLQNTLTLLTGLPALAVSGIDQAVKSAVYITNTVVNAFADAFEAVQATGFEDGWNALVNGLLGEEGTVGSLFKLTVGFGVGDPTDTPSTFIPSVRQLFSGFGISGNLALTNLAVPPVPEPTASMRTSAGSAATRSRTGARAAAADSASNPAKRSTARAGARASASR